MRPEAWVGAGALLAVLGVLAGSPVVATLGVVLLAGVLAARAWAAVALRGVRYERSLTPARLYAGESAELEVALTNRKPLLLPWIVVQDRLDPHLVLRSTEGVRAGARLWELRQQVSVGWYQRVRLRYRLECPRRGLWELGPGLLQSGDPFGLYERERAVPDRLAVLVYPRLVPLDRLALPRRFPYEGVRTGRGPLDDPLNVVAVRPYSEGDTRRQVHWRASARTAGLQSKVWRPTTEQAVVVFLDLASGALAWEGDGTEAVEEAISTAATLLHRVHAERRALGLYANGRHPGTRHGIRMGLARGEVAFAQAMELLARVYPYPIVPLAELLRTERRTLPAGATIVAVSAAPTPALNDEVALSRRSGRAALLLRVGMRAPEAIPPPRQPVGAR